MKKLKVLLIIIIVTLIIIEIIARIIGYSSYSLLTKEESKNFLKMGLITSDINEKPIPIKFLTANKNGYMVFNKNIPFNPEKEKEFLITTPKIFHYLSNYFKAEQINEFGFRDWTKKDLETTKKRIAIIGDSFVWGIGAQPVDSSFTKLLSLDSSLQVFNLAIPGIDLSVYANITEEFIPLIKPDLTIICIYASNDLVNYDKKLIPNEYNDIYPTNQGGYLKLNENYISNDSVEVFSDLESVYNYTKSIVHFDSHFLSILASYNMLYRSFNGLNGNSSYRFTRYKKSNFSKKFMANIRQNCTKSGSQLKIVMIPSTLQGTHKMLEKELETIVIEPTEFSNNDFNKSSDGLFTNAGHKKYAEFLKNLISETNH